MLTVVKLGVGYNGGGGHVILLQWVVTAAAA